MQTRIALIQCRFDADPDKNRKNLAQWIAKAAKRKPQIVFLPELCTTRYFPYEENKKFFALAESVPGPSTDFFGALAKKHQCVIVVPLFEKRTQGLYHNTAAVIDADGKYLGKYRKMHIPDDPCFYEKYYFAPGDLGFKVFDTKHAKLGVLICWDQWYPEAARAATLAGAQILFYPTAIGWHDSEKPAARKLQRNAWQTIQTSHAVANGVYVVSANRTGREKKLNFWGTSFVAAPSSEILAEAPVNTETVLYAECDLGAIDRIRQEWPFLRDRRVDAYQPILKRFAE